MDPGIVAAPSGRTLVEFPMSAAPLLGLRLPVSGGGYFRILPYWVTRTGLRSINARGAPFTFYLHPWEIDAEQPRVSGISWLSRFRHYTNLHICEARLRQVLSEFRFAPMHDVLEAYGLLPAGAAPARAPPASADPSPARPEEVDGHAGQHDRESDPGIERIRP